MKTSYSLSLLWTGIIILSTTLAYTQGFDIEQPINNQNGTIELNLRRAKAIMATDVDSAQVFLLAAKELADSVGNTALQAEIGRQLGNSYWSVGSYNLALEYYLKVLPQYDELNNFLGVAMIYNNLGEVYKKLHDYETALSYHQRSLATKIEHLDVAPLMSYYNIGELYQIQGDFDTARYFYHKLLSEANFDKDQRAVAYAYAGLGTLNIKLRRMPVAVDFFEKALNIRKEINDLRGVATSYMNLAQVYLLIARHSMAAYTYADSAQTIIEQIHATDLEIDNYLIKGKVDSVRGDYLSAIKNFQRHHFLKDSLYSLQKTYQINELLTSYETEKTIRENQALIFQRDLNAAELKSNRVTITLISVGLIIAILLGIRLKMANNTVKLQKRELTKKAEDLEQALKHLAARNEENKSFSYTVSHDLKAPIRVISYYCKILKDEWKELDDQAIEKQLDGITTNLKKMQSIIRDMLDLSRVSQSDITLQPVRLDEVAHEIIRDFKIADPDREIEIEVESNLSVNGDPAMLTILLKNLLENAWKYTQGRDKPKIALTRFDNDTFVVADNGVGFDMDYYEKLFIPFKRLHGDSEFEGTGIGLSIAKRIIDKHGGRIWAESKIEEGSQFYFSLS